MPVEERIALRIIHILFGVFWAGSAIFIAVILQPRLQKLEPKLRGQVMGALIPIMGPMLIGSAFITIIAGTTLALRMTGGDLAQFVETKWGLTILIGFVASIGAISSGITTVFQIRKMLRLGSVIANGTASSEDYEDMQSIENKLPRLARGTALMVVVAIIAMASARFV